MKKQISLLSLALCTLALGGAPALAQSEGSMSPPSSSPAGWPGEGQNLMASRTLGVGIGTAIGAGTDLFQPNVASVRFTASDSIVLEPMVVLSYADQNDTSATQLSVGGTGRYFLRSTGPVQLDFLGRAMLGYTSIEDTRTVMNIGLHWGLGLSWFFGQNWGMSLDATNPFVDVTRTDPEVGDATTDMLLGLIWNPTVLAMVHLYM